MTFWDQITKTLKNHPPGSPARMIIQGMILNVFLKHYLFYIQDDYKTT